MTPTDISIMVAIGLGAGLVGGALGVGGGIVMIPAMALLLGTTFGPESFHLYKLAAITTAAALSIPAVMRHWRARAISGSLVRGALPAAALGVLVGVGVAGCFVEEQTRVLRRLFGGFLLAVVVFNLWQARRSAALAGDAEGDPESASAGLLKRAAVGGPAGVLAGLLGVGGGVWMVPFQRMALRMPLRNAIANSSALILPLSIVASAAKAVAIGQTTSLTVWHGYALAAILTPGALLGAWIGAGLTHRLPVPWLRLAFQVLLLAAGLRLMLG